MRCNLVNTDKCEKGDVGCVKVTGITTLPFTPWPSQDHGAVDIAEVLHTEPYMVIALTPETDKPPSSNKHDRESITDSKLRCSHTTSDESTSMACAEPRTSEVMRINSIVSSLNPEDLSPESGKCAQQEGGDNTFLVDTRYRGRKRTREKPQTSIHTVFHEQLEPFQILDRTINDDKEKVLLNPLTNTVTIPLCDSCSPDNLNSSNSSTASLPYSSSSAQLPFENSSPLCRVRLPEFPHVQLIEAPREIIYTKDLTSESELYSMSKCSPSCMQKSSQNFLCPSDITKQGIESTNITPRGKMVELVSTKRDTAAPHDFSISKMYSISNHMHAIDFFSKPDDISNVREILDIPPPDSLSRREETDLEPCDNMSAYQHDIKLLGEFSVQIEDSSSWSQNLTALTLVDVTPLSMIYQGDLSAELTDNELDPSVSSTGESESTLMVLRTYELMSAHSQEFTKVDLQQRALQVVRKMLETQIWLQRHGLADSSRVPRSLKGSSKCRSGKHESDASVLDKSFRSSIISCSVAEIHIDSSNRIIAEVDIEPCNVSISDIIAFQNDMLSRNELVTLVQSVLICLSFLHKAGIVHGALHSGNIMLSSNDGRCTLADPMGLMSSRIYSDDLSIIPPSKATVLMRMLKRNFTHGCDKLGAESGEQEKVSSRGFEDDLRLCMLELEESVSWYSPKFTDDLYAVGALTLFIVIGIPVSYGTTYTEVVQTLAELHALVASGEICATDDNSKYSNLKAAVREGLRARILPLPLTQNAYVSLRLQQAGYSEDFLKDLFDFILDTMAPSFGLLDGEFRYHNAEDLLIHSFFTKYSINEETKEFSMYAEDDLIFQGIRDTLHRIAYPIHEAVTRSKSSCKTKPYIIRMHRHSIFSSRWVALKRSIEDFYWDYLEERVSKQGPSDTSVAVRMKSERINALWPALGRGPDSRWVATVPWVWSLPLLPGRVVGSTDDTSDHNLCNCHMGHPSLILLENEHKLKGGVAYRLIGGEFYFSSSFSHMHSRPTRLDIYYIRDLIFRRQLESRHSSDLIFRQEKKKLEQQTGCKVLPCFNTMLFIHKQNCLLTLNQEQMDYFRDTIDTVVLKDLEGCCIKFLVPFRFVILVNVRHCEVYLSPCFMCYMHDVQFCSPLTVASTYLILHRVASATFQCTTPILFPEVATKEKCESTNAIKSDISLKDLFFEPYSLLYAGLSQDFSIVGLSEEYVASVHSGDPFVGPARAIQSSAQIPTLQKKYTRDFNFIAEGPRIDDIPYSHALIAHGKLFKHSDDNESDVYFFFNELHAKDVHVVNVHGDAKAEMSSFRSECCNGEWTSTPYKKSQETAQEFRSTNKLQPIEITSSASEPLGYRGIQRHSDRDVYVHSRGTSNISCASKNPLIFVLDAVGDVLIRNCSYCTVFLVGSMGSMVIHDCHHMRIFYVARECLIEGCTGLEIFALVTEYIALERCHSVTLSPLFLECPYFDRILQSVISETSEEYKKSVFEAYEKRDINSLNKVLQVDEQICLSGCEGVEIRDMLWFEEHPSERFFLFFVMLPAFELQQTREGGLCSEVCIEECKVAYDRIKVESSILPVFDGTSSCSFFRECFEAAQVNMDLFFQHLSLSEMLYKYMPLDDITRKTKCETSALRHLICVHDLLNPFLVRFPGNFRIRSTYWVPSNLQPTSEENSLYKGQAHSQSCYYVPSDKCGKYSDLRCDVILERIVTGRVYFLDAIDNLCIRDCTGPLDIFVCAAKNVVMEGCVNVTLRTACMAFDAQDSHHCHIALHVNTPPGYLRCSHMLTSALNVVAPNLSECMNYAGVKPDVNFFDQPLIHSVLIRHPIDKTSPIPNKEAVFFCNKNTISANNKTSEHYFDQCLRQIAWVSKGTRLERLSQAFAYIRRPIAIVPSLPQLFIRLRGRESCSGRLGTDTVEKMERTQTLEETLKMALCFIAESDLEFCVSEGGRDRVDPIIALPKAKEILEHEQYEGTEISCVPIVLAPSSEPKSPPLCLSDEGQEPLSCSLASKQVPFSLQMGPQEGLSTEGYSVTIKTTVSTCYPPPSDAESIEFKPQSEIQEVTLAGSVSTQVNSDPSLIKMQLNSADVSTGNLYDDRTSGFYTHTKYYPCEEQLLFRAAATTLCSTNHQRAKQEFEKKTEQFPKYKNSSIPHHSSASENTFTSLSVTSRRFEVSA